MNIIKQLNLVVHTKRVNKKFIIFNEKNKKQLTLINRIVYSSEMVAKVSSILKEFVTLQAHGEHLFIVNIVEMSVVLAPGREHLLKECDVTLEGV